MVEWASVQGLIARAGWSEECPITTASILTNDEGAFFVADTPAGTTAAHARVRHRMERQKRRSSRHADYCIISIESRHHFD
jgi:hypothetical protein